MDEDPVTPPTPRQALIARGEQVVLAILAMAVVAAVAYRGISYWRIGAEPLEMVPAASPVYRVDVNEADWATLALVPGLGEVLSRQIVAERERRGGRFARLEDLVAVQGIHTKVLEKLRPYLFVSGAAAEEPVRMSGDVLPAAP